MNTRIYINYLFKFHRLNKIKFAVSICCLTICYLALETVISFSTIIEFNSQETFKKYFNDANFIITTREGIKFDKDGNLQSKSLLNPVILAKIKKQFIVSDYRLIQNNRRTTDDTYNISYIVFGNEQLNKEIKNFCKNNNIKILNSFYVSDDVIKYDALLYDIKGTGNRFTIFSFQNQISAFILGAELSSSVGFISRVMFIFSVVFTFYISLLYFQERKNEFSTLIIQGHTDKNMKLIFIDCIFQNIISFILSILFLSIILFLLTKNTKDFQHALTGLFFILPYLPALIIIQLLLLLNRSINYASKFK